MKTKKQGLHQEMERFLCPKTGEDQRSFPRFRAIFMSEHTSNPKSNQTYSACQWGRGLISSLVQISVLRLLKTLYFAYSVCQCGEGYSSPRPPPLATLFPCLEQFLRPNTLQVRSQIRHILHANMPMGEGINFKFSANIGLKTAKNVVFCIFCMSMWERL